MFPLVLIFLVGAVAYASMKGGDSRDPEPDPKSKLPDLDDLPDARVIEFDVGGEAFEYLPATGEVFYVGGGGRELVGTASGPGAAAVMAGDWLGVLVEPGGPSNEDALIYEVWLDSDGNLTDINGDPVDDVVELDVCAGDHLVLHYPAGADLSPLREEVEVGEVVAWPVDGPDPAAGEEVAAWDISGGGDGTGAGRWFVGIEYMDPDTYEVTGRWGFDVVAQVC